MTHFEYISVAMSIVLSFAVLRLLDAVPHLGDPKKRYWIHAFWVGMLLYWSAVFWWLSWSHRTREGQFDFHSFLLLVSHPGLLYLCATTLVSPAPAEVASWAEHYWSVRRRFFGFALALLVSLVLSSTYLVGVPLVHPLRVTQSIFFVFFVSAFMSRSERVHAVIATLFAAMMLMTIILSLVGSIRLDLAGNLP